MGLRVLFCGRSRAQFTSTVAGEVAPIAEHGWRCVFVVTSCMQVVGGAVFILSLPAYTVDMYQVCIF